MTASDQWPEEIPIEGITFKIRAVKKGFDREGRMRYDMRYADDGPVRLIRAQYHRDSVGISFNSPLGTVAFDFKMENEEED